jgi:hypothetical protein
MALNGMFLFPRSLAVDTVFEFLSIFVFSANLFFCFFFLNLKFWFGLGMTEAFLHATANTQQLNRYNGLLIVCSFLYLGAIVVCVNQWGSVGLILANCFSEFLFSIADYACNP